MVGYSFAVGLFHSLHTTGLNWLLTHNSKLRTQNCFVIDLNYHDQQNDVLASLRGFGANWVRRDSDLRLGEKERFNVVQEPQPTTRNCTNQTV